MPVFYREKVIDPENSQKPLKQQPLHQSNGQSYQYQSKTSHNFPGSGSSTATTATDFPANFPKIPPPKGVIDDKQLERMAEQLMKGQQPTWDGQQFSPPGWTRHSQQSYTIETVVEHPPETRPIYVGKHYESVPPKTTGIPPQTQPKQQFSPQHIRTAQPPPSNYSYQAYNQPVSPQRQPTRTAQPPTSSYSSSQVYGQPQKPQEYYQQPEQLKHQEQKYTKTFQQKPQIPAQVNIQEQQKQFIPPQRQQQNGTPYREERKDIVDSANFPSQQQYSKTLTEFREQTNGQPTQQPPQKLQLQQKQWEAVQSPQEKWNQTQWQQSQQWQSQQQQPQQTQQQWEKTLQWQQAPKQPEQWPQQQSKQWQQTEQPKQQEWQKPQQSQQKYITQQDQQQVQQQYSPQKPYIPQEKEQTQLKQQPIETNVQAQQTQNLSGTTKLQQKETEKQNIEQDLGEEYDGPPPELQLAQADPGKINEKQQENVHQNGWQQDENYDHQPYRSHHLNQRQLQETRNNYDEPLYISAGGDDGYQHQYHQYYSPNSQIYWDSVYNDEWALRGANPPSFTTGPVWGDHLAYAQRVNYEKRRAESEKQRRHHTPVPGSAEYGYLFGGMDFVDHNNFDPSTYVGEPFNEMQERHSRRDLHWGPPRRRGDFFGLDYRTMLPEEEQHRSHSAEDSNFYQGYQALPPRKNFRLCGHFTADHNAPLNIAEAQGLDEFDSQYWVGDTLSNQKVRPEHPLTEEQKRTFALLYGPAGFKPDHRTVIPEPKPEEPVQFSVTIGPKKEKKEQTEGYVNPMKVEGESWMLGQRGEYDGYGKLLHSTAEEHLPFHRPRQFPARVPNWAVERMNQMGRGARSLDRSLFLPSWAKVPQPQPPFWVKRDGSKVAGGWQMPKQEPQQSEIQQNKRENVQNPPQKQQYVVKQSQTINSPQQKELTLPQKTEQPSPQPSPQQSQKTQIGSWGQPIMQKLPPSTQIEQKVEQKQPQKDEADKNLQKSKQQIFTQSHQRPNYQQQTNVTATQSQQAVQPNQHHTLHQSFTSAPDKDTQNQQFTQLIVTPSKTHQTTFKPAKQPLTSRQEQQQQSQQQQQYYNFYEGNVQTRTFPQQEQFKKFTSPGGQFYGQKGESEVKNPPQQQYIVNQTTHSTTNPSGQYYGRIPAQQRTEQQYPYKIQQQPQQVRQGGGDPKTPQSQPQGQLKEESGLENLAKLKLGKFPMRESLEAQQSLESDPSIDSNKRQPQQFIRQVRESPGQQQVTREEWRFTGPPHKGGHQLLQSSTTTTTTTSSISGDNQ